MISGVKKKFGKHFYRGGVFHHSRNYSKVLDRFKNQPDKKIINIGSGGYDPVPGAINVDPYRGGPGTVRAFGEDLPFDDESIDVAIGGGILEHVKEPEKIIAEVLRVLKPGGEIYFEVGFLEPFHSAPGDFHRWTISGLRFMCRDFEEVEVGISNGPGSAVAWILIEYSQILTKNKHLRFVFKNLTKIIVSPLKYLDKLLLGRENIFNVAQGLYFLGRKPE